MWAHPFAFRPFAVTFWVIVIYTAVLIPLLIVHEVVPRATTPAADLDEAWNDLKTLTRRFHPVNSHANDDVRAWLLARIGQLLDENGVSWATETLGRRVDGSGNGNMLVQERQERESLGAVLFDDRVANFTSTSSATRPGDKTVSGSATYFEGSNIYVYIRGKRDEPGSWWLRDAAYIGKMNANGVLVNTHFDSVSTAYGATDAGSGVVTILQLIKHFTKKQNQPENGIIALLNNGEEDFLLGSKAFGQSPVLPFIHVFLNLEGAGAGGKALLFRASDQQVVQAYRGVRNPFGSVVANDEFKLGAIRSQTDFVILDGVYGQRGLDMSFYRPRSRYHTNQDDVGHTSKDSLSHMLESARTTVQNLAADTSDRFKGRRADGDHNKVQNGNPSDGVWFDLLSNYFSVFSLRSLFAWSLTFLIVSPIILMLLTALLIKSDKYYLFTNKIRRQSSAGTQVVQIGGWKGFFRFPIFFGISVVLTLVPAFVLKKVNPLIVYSSEYSVWAMTISLFTFLYWFLMRGADYMRPSALHRVYVLIWLFAISWCLLVAVTVFEDRFHIAGGYPFVFLHASIFFALVISLCELFSLPKIRDGAIVDGTGEDVMPPTSAARSQADGLTSPLEANANGGEINAHDDENDDEDVDEGARHEEIASARPNETTSLTNKNHKVTDRTTFTTGYRRSAASVASDTPAATPTLAPMKHHKRRGVREQPWSVKLVSWPWLLQLLILAPLHMILIGQVGLIDSTSLSQTGPDGSNLLLPYLSIVAFSILMLLPITPFAHRMTWHIPIFLLLVFAGTFIYNLAAFPFSEQSRYKVYFQQSLNLETNVSSVRFEGLETYVHRIIAELPSARGKTLKCGRSTVRPELTACRYDGTAVLPRLLPSSSAPSSSVSSSYSPTFPAIRIRNNTDSPNPPLTYRDLVTLNISRTPTPPGSGPDSRASAELMIDAYDTRACVLEFARPIASLDVNGAVHDTRLGMWPEDGLRVVRLWRRDRNMPWRVRVTWRGDGNGNEGFVRGSQEKKVAAGQANAGELWSSSRTLVEDEDEEDEEEDIREDEEEDEEEDEAEHGSDIIDIDELRRRSRRRHHTVRNTSLSSSATTLALPGTLRCLWSDANNRGTIPALDEMWQFAPSWATVSKLTDGLVEGELTFTL